MKNKHGPKVRCRICGDIVQSMHVHDFKWCKGGHFFVDGGGDYFKCGGDFGAMEELSDETEQEKQP